MINRHQWLCLSEVRQASGERLAGREWGGMGFEDMLFGFVQGAEEIEACAMLEVGDGDSVVGE